MRKVLITGSNSYIGNSFEQYLSQWPDRYQVDALDMHSDTWKSYDFSTYDVVLHVAGIAHTKTNHMDEDERKRYWTVNAVMPVEAAQIAKKSGVRQFIFLSSMSVYGEVGSIVSPIIIDKDTPVLPKDIYGESKLAAEKELQKLSAAAFHVCVLRPPMIYGKGCKGNYNLLAKAALSLPLFPSIDNQRSMLYIDNLCSVLRQCIDQYYEGLLCPQNDEYVSTSSMVSHIAQKHGKRMRLSPVFNPLIRLLSHRFQVINKIFGTLIYDKYISSGIECERSITFEQSIAATEDIT